MTKKGVANDAEIPKVDDRGYKRYRVVGSCDVVVGAVCEHVPRCGAPHEKGPPPPLVVLCAQLQVAQNEANLGADEEEDAEYEGKEPKKVVEAMLPDGREDEEELNKDGAKGEQAPNEHRDTPVQVPLLGRDLAGDGVGAGGESERLRAKPEVSSEKGERNTDEEGESQHGDKGPEGDGVGRTLSPDDHVEDEEDNRAHTLERQGGEHRDLELAFFLEDLAEPGGKVARESPREEEEEEDSVHERASV
mmetsp:Transcript_5981/g.13763  ORF Transcript_5981/g.13763 Transcript_5981/m.13763 type:complete len:248 (+) Transcript_5981:859-1602(+)